MSRRQFTIREIALQAALSEATVDRVLHRRGGVRERTVRAVEQAIADLERQQSQLQLTGRTFLVDLVMQAPHRFSTAVRQALEAELPTLRPAVLRCRFDLRESATAEQIAKRLDRIGHRRSHGVILKATDEPAVAEAIDRLVAARIPVVTLVTDVPGSRRLAYVGIDNAAAGATAAYLVRQWLGPADGDVLLTLSRHSFRGEQERARAFTEALGAGPGPRRNVVTVADTDGLDQAMRTRVAEALRAYPKVRAVYSAGGGNVGTIDAFRQAGREYAVFLAHDLDTDNLRLLRRGEVSAVLHHDLRQDVRRACYAILQAHRALPGAALSWASNIVVVTPHNLPTTLPGPPDDARLALG